MKPRNRPVHPLRLFLLLIVAMLVNGCAGMQPVTLETPHSPEPHPEPAPQAGQPAQTGDQSICGTLFDYALDIHQLNGQQRSASLSELGGEGSSQYFCDTIKTGILLSQISQTAAEDDVAISILNEYSGSEKLSDNERWLLRLLEAQSRERRRLHLLLGQYSDKLVDQETLNTNLSTELLTLRQQLYELQKIETDINETEQTIATPAATADKQATESPGS